MDSNHSKPNLNHLNEIGSIRKSSKHLKGILIIRMQIRSNLSKPNLNHSNEIRSIRMQISTIQNGFECKFEAFERDL